MKRLPIGFTLIELVVAVAIVGILAAIAIPNYQSSVKKSRRADAQGALMGFANAMERRFTLLNHYCDAALATGGIAVTGCGTTTEDKGSPLPAVFQAQSPTDGGTKYYDLTIVDATSSTYTLRATPIATAATGVSTAQKGDGFLELFSTGVKRWDKNNNGTIDTGEDNWNN